MPIYEYQCQHCEHKLEAIQKVGDASLTDCPQCKQETLRKLVSAAIFKLKGDGWYETDFKDKKPQKKDTPEKNDKKGDDLGKGSSKKDGIEKEGKQPSKDKGDDKTDKSDKKSESTSEPTTEKPKDKTSLAESSKQ